MQHHPYRELRGKLDWHDEPFVSLTNCYEGQDFSREENILEVLKMTRRFLLKTNPVNVTDEQ